MTVSGGRDPDFEIPNLKVGLSSHVQRPRTISPFRNPHNRRSPSLTIRLCCAPMAPVFDNGIHRSMTSVPLKYTIAAASEHSGVYVASNILRDEPTDSTSRWSGASQIPHVKQWVTLRLDNLAVLSLVPCSFTLISFQRYVSR